MTQDDKRQFYCSQHLENSKGVSSPMPEIAMKTTYVFLIINHNITSCILLFHILKRFEKCKCVTLFSQFYLDK